MVPIATMQPNTIRDSKSERISVMVFSSPMSRIAPIGHFVNLGDSLTYLPLELALFQYRRTPRRHHDFETVD